MGDMRVLNGSILKTSDRIKVRVSCWDRYDIGQYENKMFIVGTSSAERDLWEYREMDSRTLLDSLLILAFDVERKPANKMALMLKWCKKYGLPFWSIDGHTGCEYGTRSIICDKKNELREHPQRDVELPVELIAQIAPVVYGAGVSAYYFERALRALRTTFAKSSIVVDGGVSIGEPLPVDDRYKKEDAIQDLSYAFIYAPLHYGIVFGSGRATFEWHAYTPFIAAYYQMALLLVSPDGYCVKTCPECGAQFIARRENHIYCKGCTPQKRWNRKQRNKEV